MRNYFLLILALIIPAAMYSFFSCKIEQVCYSNRDCSSPEICTAAGRCILECIEDAQCGTGFSCLGNKCQIMTSETQISCPDDMVNVENVFCMDKYEASRQDAASDSPGIDNSKAQSVVNVIPWTVSFPEDASDACLAADKRLCTATEWQTACEGPKKLTYAYGNTYDQKICNGIDAYGRTNFHIAPTGSFPDCQNHYGAFDMNGNVWEQIKDGTNETVRGGAYNSSDSETFLACTYIPTTWTPGAKGFRCCKDGI